MSRTRRFFAALRMAAILLQIVAYGSKDITILEAIMWLDPRKWLLQFPWAGHYVPTGLFRRSLEERPVSGAMVFNSVEVFMVQFIRSLLLGALVLALGLGPIGCGKEVKPTTEKPSSQDKMREMQDKGGMREGMERGRAAGGAEGKDKGSGKENGKDKEEKDKNEDDKE